MAPDPPPTSSSSGSPRLLARTELLLRIEQRLWRDGGRGVLLTGRPGMGKRTLAHDIAARAERSGRRVVRLVAAPGSVAIPYAALAPMLGMGPDDDEHARFLAAREVLAAGRPTSTPLVTVADIGFLDSRTVAVLTHMVASGELRLLATESSAERQRSVLERFDPAGLEELEVPPLSADDLTRLVRRSFDGPVDSKLSEDLVELSDGVPLHLRQLITSSLDEGIIRKEGGWYVAAGGKLPRARSLERAVSDELDRLPPPEQEAVDLLAVAGQIGTAELDRLVPETAIDALERREVFQLSPSGRRLQVAFRRPLTAVVAASRLSTLRRRRLCGSVANAIESAGARRRDDKLRTATLRVRAGLEQDPALLSRAAATALEDEDCDLAEELARAAGGDRRSGPLAARLTLAHALSRLGRLEEADAVLAGAEPVPGDEETWFAVVLVTGEHRVWSRDVGADDALAGLPRAPSPRAEATLAAIAAGWAVMGGDLAAADVLRQRAADELERIGDDPRLANQLRYVESVIACHRLRGEHGATLATDGLAALPQVSTSVAERNAAGFLVALGLCQLSSGRLDDARATFEAGTAAAGRNGVPRGIAFFDVNAARIGHLDGRLVHMAHLARRVARLGDELGIAMAEQLGRFHQALALAASGAMTEAEQVIEAASKPANRLCRFEHDRTLAWIHAGRGELGQGVALLAAAADQAERDGLAYLELVARLDLVRLGRGPEQAPRTAALAAGAEGALAHAVARAAGTVADRDATGLLDAVGTFEALGATLVAAELTALAAELHRASGAAGAAAAAEIRCRQLRERGDPAASPAFARLAGDERLTDRERELAELAARGWSNADIAGTLVLSVRTVENHLQRAYRKLGVRGRGDLSTVLGVSPATEAVTRSH